MVISLKAKLKLYAFKRFLKRYKVSISHRDSGNEIHNLGDAYQNINWDLAKFKPVTVWSSHLSSLTRKLCLAETDRELESLKRIVHSTNAKWFNASWIFSNFVDCVCLMIIVQKPKIAYFSKLFCSTVYSQSIESCDISEKQVYSPNSYRILL